MTAPAERDALLERLAGLPAGFTLRRCPARADEAPPALETDGRGELELHALLPGVTLAYWAVLGGTVRLAGARRPALIAACCRRGSLRCAPDGGLPALDAGTIAICGQPDCPRTLALPDGVCEGLALRFDCPSLAAQPPALLDGAHVSPAALAARFCGGPPAVFPAGSPALPPLMALFDLPEALRPAYGRLRALETLLCLHRLLHDGAQQAAQRPAAMEAVHAYLMEHLDQRIPIDALARRFLMNPTTLKAAFKAAYGASLAAHIRAHRMERAAALLRGTDQSVAAIASAVGYESQSKLTAAFRDAFGMPPTEYRRRHATAAPAPGGCCGPAAPEPE